MANDDAYYKYVCSSLTLQSERKGFFQVFADNVFEAAGDAWLKKFATLTTDEERIMQCYNDTKTRDVVQGTLENVQKVFRSKSASVARQKRLEAEHLEYSGKTSRAILMANQSVIRAPPSGTDTTVDNGLTLPLALGLRAKLFYNNKSYDLALADIKLALKNKLPEGYKLDAYLKMADCYLNMAEKDKAKVCLTIVAKLAKELSRKDVLEKSEEMLLNLDSLVKDYVKKPAKVLPPVTDGPSAEFPRATRNVGRIETKHAGRTIVAKMRISTGDTLFAEPAYASALLTEKHGTHCLHCFNRIEGAVGCPSCSGVAFCSDACCTEALKTYHRWECPFLELMIGSGMSILSFLALRIITQQPLTFFTKLRKKIKDPTFRHPYVDVYRLEAHADKREPRDFLNRTLMALFLLRILRLSGYFGTVSPSDGLNEDEVLIGSLLLRHLQVLQYNAHEVYETVHKPGSTLQSASTIYIGIGLYPTVAYMNHDCHPAITRHFIGTAVVIKAGRPIDPGEVVPENYGPVFTLRTLKERQRSLAGRYLFNCQCRACTEDWPKLCDMDENAVTFMCSKTGCSGSFKHIEGDSTEWSCPECGEKMNRGEAFQLYKSYCSDMDSAISLLDKGYVKEATPQLTHFLEMVTRLVKAPNHKLCTAHEALRSCYAELGNVFSPP